MTREEIIDGLKFTVDMYLFDPDTGETFTEPRSKMSKITVDACRGAIELLEQEPKIGHWIIIDDCEQFIAKCSECGRIEDSRMISKYLYCHCGAKMQEVKG